MKSTLSLFAILVLFVSFISCREKQDTLVEITVRNSSSQLVSGAVVTLKAVPTIDQHGDIVDFGSTTTNAQGKAIFTFNDTYQLGQAGVAVLDIEAEKDGKTGTGIIKVVEETTSTEVLYLAP